MKRYFIATALLVVSTFIFAQDITSDSKSNKAIELRLVSGLPEKLAKEFDSSGSAYFYAMIPNISKDYNSVFVCEKKTNGEIIYLWVESDKEINDISREYPIKFISNNPYFEIVSNVDSMEISRLILVNQFNSIHYREKKQLSSNIFSKISYSSTFTIGLIWGYSQGFSINGHYFPSIKTPTNQVLIFDGLSLGYLAKFNLHNNYYLETKPEIVLFSYFTGIGNELGIRKILSEDFSISANINLHYTIRWRGGTDHTGWANRPGWFAFPGIKIYYRYYLESIFFVGLYYSDISNYYHYHAFSTAFEKQKDLKWYLTSGIEF